MARELSAKEKKLKLRLEKALHEGDGGMFARGRRLFGILPSDPRCTGCMAPFEGYGGKVFRNVFNIKRSTMNPLLCNRCDKMVRQLEYGAETEMGMLFADMRGSTTLAEKMNTIEFKELIDRFYTETTNILIHSYATIDKLVGDEVSGYYLPTYLGKNYVKHAIKAARDMLTVTGHADPGGPWAPIGIGVHFGTAYYGAVTSVEGLVDLTALGDAVNTASRLASNAATGEILISDAAAKQANLDTTTLISRSVEMKGKSAPMDVWVMDVSSLSNV
jgi:adenylate cyclase